MASTLSSRFSFARTLATLLFFTSISASFAASNASSASNASYYSASPDFAKIIGQNLRVTLLAESDLPMFHEGAVWHPPTKSLFVSSDVISEQATGPNVTIVISHVTGSLTSTSSTQVTTLDGDTTHGIPLPIGAYRYVSSQDVIVWAGQGTDKNPGGLWFFNPRAPYNATRILSEYGPYPLNSPNDVAVTPSGEIYFSDPTYGCEYDYKSSCVLPNQVYRFDPATDTVRAVADGFGRSNGVGINEDGSVVYVIDTGAQIGNGTIDYQAPRTIYSFDVQKNGNNKNRRGGLLGNRKLFAFPNLGGAKGVKTDTDGNVYVGIDDGVSVFGDQGDLLGKILIDGVANIGFGEPGVLFAMGETKLWRIDLSKDVIGSSFTI